MIIAIGKYIITKCWLIINFLKLVNSNIFVGKNTLILRCRLKGRGLLTIGKNTSLIGCRFYFKGKNNVIEIGNNVKLHNVTFWFEDDNNRIILGDRTTIEGECQLAACEGTNIVIGKDCMFSRDIYIRTTDSHSIIDLNNNRLNKAKNIIIGNHVWIGMQCLILKGANIPDNCIVGARSLISSGLKVKSNSIIAGQPANTIKESINWCRNRI